MNTVGGRVASVCSLVDRQASKRGIGVDQLVATDDGATGAVASDGRRAIVSAFCGRLLARAGLGQPALGGFFRTATAGQSLVSPRFTRVSALVGGELRFPPGRCEHRSCLNRVSLGQPVVGLDLQVLRRLMAGKRSSSRRRQSPKDVMVMLLFPFPCDLLCRHSSCND